ncbi:MAG: hypothetical protein ACK5ME_09665 [Parahaliea sp.]
MSTRKTAFNAQELCSRKLWRLVHQRDINNETTSEYQRRLALAELLNRQHKRTELATMGANNHC